jgi:hypothetical protein
MKAWVGVIPFLASPCGKEEWVRIQVPSKGKIDKPMVSIASKLEQKGTACHTPGDIFSLSNTIPCASRFVVYIRRYQIHFRHDVDPWNFKVNHC